MTYSEERILRFIAGYQQAHGHSPTLREIMAGIGSRSLNVTHREVMNLTAAGHMRRLPRRARAVEITTPVSIPRSPSGAPLYFVEVR